MEILALVKHDCPVCDELLPVLDRAATAGAPIRVVSQSSAADTAAQAARLNLSAVPTLDEDLALSVQYDPDAVPALLLLDSGVEQVRVEGIARERLAGLAQRAGIALELEQLPEWRPGCASLT